MANKLAKFILGVILVFSVLALISGCSAAKRAQKQATDLAALQKQMDEQKTAIGNKAIEEYVENNPCDFPEINLDSILLLYCPGAITPSSAEDLAGPKDTAKSIDTSKGLHEKPNRVLVPYEDKRHVKLLEDSNTALRSRLASCEAKAAGKKEAIADIIPVIKKATEPGNWYFDNWAWLSLSLIALIIIYTILRFKKLIP